MHLKVFFAANKLVFEIFHFLIWIISSLLTYFAVLILEVGAFLQLCSSVFRACVLLSF